MAEAPIDATPLEIHRQAHGPHGIAWATRGPAAKPERSVIVVAETPEQAEKRAREWFEASAQQGQRVGHTAVHDAR
jgi:hypothetical protein